MIEQARIQAEMVVPIVRAMVDELGTERAFAIVRTALDGYRRDFVTTLFSQLPGETNLEKARAGLQMFTQTDGSGLAFDPRVVRDDGAHFDFDVVSCQWAELFAELGEPEIGHLLFCSQDFVWCSAIEGMELERTTTIMQGADHCDFRVRLTEVDVPPG